MSAPASPRRGLVPLAPVEAAPAAPRPASTGQYRIYRSEGGGFELYLDEGVLRRFLLQARRLAPNECIGVLLGTKGSDARGRFVVVSAAVLDTMAKATPTTVETTPASEAATRQLAREQFPDLVPVGWPHSHPRLGVFFSGTDRANQAAWGEDGIGLVVDPWGTPDAAVFRGPLCERLRQATAERPATAVAVRPAAPAAAPAVVPPIVLPGATEATPRRPHSAVAPTRRTGRWPARLAALAALAAAFALAWKVGQVEDRVAAQEARAEAAARLHAQDALAPAAAPPPAEPPEEPPDPLVCGGP